MGFFVKVCQEHFASVTLPDNNNSDFASHPTSTSGLFPPPNFTSVSPEDHAAHVASSLRPQSAFVLCQQEEVLRESFPHTREMISVAPPDVLEKVI